MVRRRTMLQGVKMFERDSESRILDVQTVRKLFRHLVANAPADGRRQWVSQERMLLYWMALKTGLRASELLQLRRDHLRLDGLPALVVTNSFRSKNESRWVPLARGLVPALRDHVSMLPSNRN